MIGLSALVTVAFGTLFYAFSVLITDEAAGAEFSITVLSVAWSGSVLVGGAVAFLIGRHADRRGVRGIMAAGAVIGATGLALVAAAHEPWHVIVASWVFIGAGGAMTFYEPAFVAIDQWFDADGRIRSLAMLTVIGGLAGPIFLPLTSILVSELGWRTTAYVLGLVLLVTGLATTALLFPEHAQVRVASSGPGPEVSLFTLLKDRRFAYFTAATLLGFAALQAIIFHRIALFEEAGFDVTTVAVWASAAGLLSLPARYAAPYMSRYVTPVLLTAAAFSVLTVAAVFAAVSDANWHMGAHFVVFGVAFGALLPLRAVVMSNWFSGPGYGRIMGVQWTIVATSAAAGPLLVGIVRDAAGSYTVPLAAVAATLAIAAMLSTASGARSPA